MAGSDDMRSYHARLQSFEQPHRLAKRRASSQGKGKKTAGTIEWPHESPSPDSLAHAGFFYRPAHDSVDNVQCFSCGVKLDGWEPQDDPLREHMNHITWCAWAISQSVKRAPGREDETRDPMSDEMVTARRGTFDTGEGWPHEGKRGWRCKTTQMVEAGWTMDPSPDMEDGVTCMYCSLSLDGWEPKDDPFQEHKRRSPDCRFFVLMERYHGTSAPVKTKKGRGRSSTASKASRMSTHSMLSVASEVPSVDVDVDVDEEGTRVDDSVMSTASTTRGKKKVGKKPASKAAKGKKRAAADDEPEPEYGVESELPAEEPAHATGRGGTRTSKLADSSMLEVKEETPPKKAGRPRKAKNKPEPEPEPGPELQTGPESRTSEAAAQLQEELEDSISQELPDGESTPHVVEPKRGTKRTSDGLKKEPELSVLDDFPAPPKPKRGRGRPSKQATEAQESVVESSAVVPLLDVSQSEAAVKPKKGTKGRKAPVKKGKAKKASSTRSSRATATETGPEPAEPEDLARDEAEIEAELERIASEQALLTEQEKLQEYEPTPSNRKEKHADAILHLEQELAGEAANMAEPSEALTNFVATVAEQRWPPPSSDHTRANQTPSPTGSDKENDPSSSFAEPLTAVKATAHTSPTKTTRVPLAPGTPTRAPLSPSKSLSRLTTSHPWIPIAIDDVLNASPWPSPGTLGDRLAVAAGALTSPEKRMTVEEWVSWRAEVGETELRRRCEALVGGFEREGVRALEALGGIGVVG
ncbi:BIR-domain-containing protein [Teratosphaeria destructans]|uniref:BIR-domain-containing protein n=1 Tax=Teratosphaeria destructans TaxID=418781 RepID=A0A9W7SJV1_9PEZI|nr:BIR-domain-containing protein [Teratosphaeria destructans]